MSVATPNTLIAANVVEGGHLLDLQLTAGKGNVLTGAVLESLRALLQQYAGDPHIRAVLLRGSGGHFSFGASVPEHQRDQAEAMLTGFHAALRAVAAHPVPVVALVEGKCLGGAFELALCCHLVLTTPTASFACPEIQLGVLPPVLTVLGGLRLGSAWMERLVLTGGELPLSAALAMGFATPVEGEDSVDAGLAWIRKNLLGLSGHSLRVATAACRAGSGISAAMGAPLDHAQALYVERLLPSHDGNEGIAAFLARRPPVWRDE